MLLVNSVSAQTEKDQPKSANPKVIELNKLSSTVTSSASGKELPANSFFNFDYRFFVNVKNGDDLITGYFDLDTKTGTIRSNADNMANTYIVRTPLNKIYTYSEIDGEKVVMEMNKGDNAFDVWFNNQANGSSLNFITAKRSDLYLKKVSGGNYEISQQTIPTENGFGILYAAVCDFAVNTGGSLDPLSGLGIFYDANSKKHYLVVKIEHPEMIASIVAMRKMSTNLDGKAYSKMSQMMSFAEDDQTPQISKATKVYKESNNLTDLSNVAQLYAGGDIELQINGIDKKLKEIDQHLLKTITPQKKLQLTEEQSKMIKAKETLNRHLAEVKKKTPIYWQQNINSFFELKAKQATELAALQ